MGDDDVLARDLRRDLAQLSGDELVGKSVKAVTAHALVVIGAGQSEGVVDEGVAAMESGIEAGDLRRRREGLHRRLDPGEVVRLVQRRERNEPLKRRDHGLVDQLRLHEIRPAVHDAMADRDDRRIVARLPEPAENGAHRGVMVDRAGRRIERETALLARGRRHAALSGRADALDLSRSKLARLGAVDKREGGEFERRRTRVQGQDH